MLALSSSKLATARLGPQPSGETVTVEGHAGEHPPLTRSDAPVISIVIGSCGRAMLSCSGWGNAVSAQAPAPSPLLLSFVMQ
jgi:hypothetical protein